DRTIGLVSTLAALAGLAQFPFGLWSDRLGRRKPFILAALAVLALATALMYQAHGTIWLALLVILFAENGVCRATVESLAGGEAGSHPLDVRGSDGALPRRQRAGWGLPLSVPETRPGLPGPLPVLCFCCEHGGLDAGGSGGRSMGRPSGTAATAHRRLDDDDAALGARGPRGC